MTCGEDVPVELPPNERIILDPVGFAHVCTFDQLRESGIFRNHPAWKENHRFFLESYWCMNVWSFSNSKKIQGCPPDIIVWQPADLRTKRSSLLTGHWGMDGKEMCTEYAGSTV